MFIQGGSNMTKFSSVRTKLTGNLITVEYRNSDTGVYVVIQFVVNPNTGEILSVSDAANIKKDAKSGKEKVDD